MKTNSKVRRLENAVELNVPVWENRYQVKKHFPFGYIIKFEEETILGWYAFENDANAICGQLNGAFNLGKGAAYLELLK